MIEAEATPLSPEQLRARRWVLFALMCTMMLAAMDTTIVATAVPQIVGDLGGFRLFSWVFSIYLLAQTVTIPIYGKLSDQFGRKPILLGGATLFLIGSLTSAFAWNMPALIAFRGLQGLGAGGVMATVITLAGDLYSVRERAAVQGWFSSVWGTAAIIGPLIGGGFADYASWRWIFLVNIPIGAVALTLIATKLHESFERRETRINYLGSTLVLLTAGTFIFALLQGGQAWAWGSWQSLTTLGTAVVLLVATVIEERHSSEPVMPGWLWKNRVTAGANLAALGMGLIMIAPDAYLPTFLQSVHGMGAIAAGLVLASMSIGWPVASTLSGKLYVRFGFRDTAIGGATLLFLSILLFIWTPQPRPIWLIVLSQTGMGAGLGMISTPIMVGIQSVSTWAQRGVVTSANMFSRYLGQSLGAAVFGALFNATVAQRLEEAPADLRGELPTEVDQVIETLHGSIGPAATAYLHDAIALATQHLFIGIAIVGAGLLLTLTLVPRVFSTLPQNLSPPRTSGDDSRGKP